MKIAEARQVIDTSLWVRNDLTGGTPEEFKRQRVDLAMADQVAKLEALVFNAQRFPDTEARRIEAIDRCQKLAARWQAAQAS